MKHERNVDFMTQSVEAILKNQSANGSVVASPDFEQYKFCWLRDASFTSFSLDLVGEFKASARYHAWVDETISAIAENIDRAIHNHRSGMELDPLNMPPARFTLEGKVVIDGWPNFQIDGYGTWLWSLGQHLRLSDESKLSTSLRSTVEKVARYLKEFALIPCFDVWEENGDAVHTSTLACVFGGLMAAGQMLESGEYLDAAESVRSQVLLEAARVGYFPKSSVNVGVDASLLWLAMPFNLVNVHDNLFQETVRLIEEQLTFAGGIRRYSSDIYYGSGAWPVLTASLGWIRTEQGDIEGAERCKVWIEEHFDADLSLGEQFDGESRDPEHFKEWVDRWGLPAKELVWSHAMFIVLSMALERSHSNEKQSALELGGT